jgi:N-acetylmuramic acid 6-phosphate etherase
MSIEDAYDVMDVEDRSVAEAVAKAKRETCAAVEAVVEAFERGGRLFYVGAGTSGRLGVLDAAECPPTFRSSPEQVRGIVAGGIDALVHSIEGAEDSTDEGRRVMRDGGIGSEDVVLGITAGGTTPFVLAALEAARAAGAATILLTCVEGRAESAPADIVIRVLTGPEVIAGSTRLKAGTATKLVLNRISTLAMIRVGKVYRNLMVDLDRGACSKLRDRATRIVAAATDLGREASRELLAAAGDVKTAIVMHRAGVDRDSAVRLLHEARGRIRDVLGS